jgi:predicted methyltransferase
MATATKKMPTATQMKSYASKLPAIYRDVLRIMYESFKDRVRGDMFYSPEIFRLVGTKYSERAVTACLEELEDGGYLKLNDSIGSIELSELGEELIAAITGIVPKNELIPKLPKPTW